MSQGSTFLDKAYERKARSTDSLAGNYQKKVKQKFSKKDVFKSNEIFTDKIVSYDKSFWENFNVIQPEEKLVKALKDFDNAFFHLIVSGDGGSLKISLNF